MNTATRNLLAILITILLSPCVFGHSITIDASQVDTNIKILGYDYIPAGEVDTYDLAEATYTLQSSQGSTFAAFSVGADGTVQYDAEYIGVISGAGTSTVTPIGYPITIDAAYVSQDIAFGYWAFVDSFLGWTESGSTRTYNLVANTNYDYPLYVQLGHEFARFAVTPDGTVQYGPEYVGVISGAGTSTVTPIGHPITIDAAGVSQDIAFGYWAISPSFLGWTESGTTRMYNLVANTSYDYPLYVYLGHEFARFAVSPDGMVQYGPEYIGVLSGAGTSTVTPVGHAITIDAIGVSQDIAFGYWAIPGSFLGWTESSTTRMYNLVANTSYDYPLYVYLGHEFARFAVSPDGMVQYGPEYIGVLSGTGTSTVVAVGHPITIDATGVIDDGVYPSEDIAFGFSSIPVSFLGWILAGETRAYDLVANTANPYTLYAHQSPMQFDIHPDGSCSPTEFVFDGYGTIKLYPSAIQDSDGDGLTDDEEAALGTNPNDSDTDDDGLLDGTEVEMAQGSGCPDPLNPDSDGDTLTDGAEVDAGTSPCSIDTDGDTIPDNIDPYPIDPEGTECYVESEIRDLADFIRSLSLDLFTAPNSNANKGRRTALANRADAAANNAAEDDFAGSIEALLSLVDRVDGVNIPKDWMVDSDEKTYLLNTATELMALLDYLI